MTEKRGDRCTFENLPGRPTKDELSQATVRESTFDQEISIPCFCKFKHRPTDAAETWNTDLLIKGAFTHSRLRQLIFGGATREILEGAPIPTLFCH